MRWPDRGGRTKIGGTERVKDKKILQNIQNRAARLDLSVGRRVHKSPLIKELHWLSFSQRVQVKICLYIYKLIKIKTMIFVITHIN